jgi:hypothetical protein
MVHPVVTSFKTDVSRCINITGSRVDASGCSQARGRCQADRWIHHQKTLFRGVPWSFEIQEVLQLKQREYFLTKGVLRDAEVAHERQLGTWEE